MQKSTAGKFHDAPFPTYSHRCADKRHPSQAAIDPSNSFMLY
jgi:hypothetical protein